MWAIASGSGVRGVEAYNFPKESRKTFLQLPQRLPLAVTERRSLRGCELSQSESYYKPNNLSCSPTPEPSNEPCFFSTENKKHLPGLANVSPSSMKNKILSVVSMKQSYWANNRCVLWHWVLPSMVAASAPEIKSTQSQSVQGCERTHLLSLADRAREKGSRRLAESRLKMHVPSQKWTRGHTMVATDGAAGPGGTRLCLSARVINSCPHSKQVLKGGLSICIYL